MKAQSIRLLYNLLAIIVLLSLLLNPVAAVPFTAETPSSSEQSSLLEDKAALYRTQVTLHQPADEKRLETLVTQILETGDGWALVIVNQTQLADLARLQFRPQQTDSLARLGFASENLTEWRSLQALIEAPMADADGDGLSDTEEEWWCTDPLDNNSDSPLPPSETNPSDGDEVQAILNGITAYGPPFALWPLFYPYHPDGDCPDGDFDSVPDFAEEFIIGTSQLRESSDKDKFDDGQELFGVTFCPAGSGPCGYGILPRAEDSAWVSANLPAWVLPPGNSPWVAAFPEPEVEVVPSSLRVTAVTTIQTETIIEEGEEHTYGTATTQGTSTSLANSVTWNEWEEVSHTSEAQGFLSGTESSSPNASPFLGIGIKAGTSVVMEGANCQLALLDGSNNCRVIKTVEAIRGNAVNIHDSLVAARSSVLWDPNRDTVQNVLNLGQCTLLPLGCLAEGYVKFNSELYTRNRQRLQSLDRIDSNGPISEVDGQNVTVSPVINISYPAPAFVPTVTTTKGREHGGAQTTTHSSYEEQTISESSTNQFSEAWSEATAINTAHAADLRFTYNIVNNGTEYAREVTSLLFNIYIGDDPNPAYSYVAVGETGQIALIENMFPGESLTFTSDPVALNLDEMRAIDEGAPVRIVMEDIAFGQDQVFYQDALNGSVLVAMEDGFDDGDEVIDTYLIAVWNPSDTVQDVLKRYFPVTEDADGNLLSISTPEFETNPPVFYEHALTGSSWWNIYMSEGLEYTGAFSTTLAAPNTTVLVRILSDRDLDGYNDRNEIRLGTDPDDAASHPNPELLAGYTTNCVGDDCTVLMTFLNTGNYDAYGVEAVMYSPDGLSEITNNTIGGSGRVPAGAQVVLGNRILQPDLTGWTGGAQPYSTGYYLGSSDRTYTMTAQTSGNIGSGSLAFNWTDGTNSGSVNFGSGYDAPLPQPIAEGVEIGFQTGSVNGGEQFVVRALTPRDTFQYTVNDPEAADPVIVVSYNDPQGNHRFILPQVSLLTDLNSDLTFLSGQMIPDPGVDIASTSPTQANFILNAPHGTPITDGHLFVEYIDLEGNVDREDVFTQTLQTGPTVIPVVVDTDVFTPTEYTLLAFFTDSQGNIIDSSARPLASFGPDPLPEAHLSAGQWLSGTTAGPTLPTFPNPWSVGTAVSGTLLTARLTLANTGLGNLRYALTGLNNGLTADSTAAGTLSPANTRTFTLTLDTAGFPAGPFTHTLTLRTSDPNQANVAIPVVGTIVPPNGQATAYPVSPYRPWDQYIFVPGPHNFNDVVTFTHTISDNVNRLHPLYLYDQDHVTLRGVGEFSHDFSGQTAPFGVFGDGNDGSLIVPSGQTITINSIREQLNASGSVATLTSNPGFVVGDAVILHQTIGAGNGNWELNRIVAINGTEFILETPLVHTYICCGSSIAQIVHVPEYHDVLIENAGTLTAPAWNGATGGILAFRATGTVDVQGSGRIDARSLGYRGGLGTISVHGSGASNAWQGESINGVGSVNSNQNVTAGGGGTGGDAGAGGGGGGYGTTGENGANGQGTGGQGGITHGSANLAAVYFGGGGGGGKGESNANCVPTGTYRGGHGTTGGGIVYIAARITTLSGQVIANGTNGGNATGGCEEGAGGGGGGGGGAIFLRSHEMTIGNGLVTSLGGARGSGTGSFQSYGGAGGVGRIYLEYGSLTGSTNPPALPQPVNFFILRQLPSPLATEIIMPDEVLSDGYIRYFSQYGLRSENANGGDQLFHVRLPKRVYDEVTLDVLLENLGASSSTIALDMGNDGTADWTANATTQPISHTSPNLAAPLNAYLAGQTPGPDGTVLVPIHVNLNTTGDIFLFNLAATPAADADVQPTALTISPLGGAPADNIAEGTPVTLTAVISNTGSHTAENFIVAFYNGDPDDGGTLIDSTFIPTLAAGDSSPIQSVAWDSTGLLGPQTIVVTADASSTVAESNESNNSQSAAAVIRKKPDLIPLTLTMPDVRVGEAVTGTAVITNDGEADVTNIPVTLYAGTPLTGTAVATDTLDVMAFSTATAVWSWTPSQVGSQLLSVAADPGDALVEADESNNTLSQTAVVGWDSLTIDAGGDEDPVYSAAWGYGRLTEGTAVTGCGNNPEQTYRQGSSTETIEYRFDNLLPGRRYHLDLTFALCSGERWVNLFVDGRPMADTTTLPGTIEPVHITTNLQTASLLLEPLDYADGTVTLSIQRAQGFGGPIVNLIDLQEIRYCYRDSGPAEMAWTAVNGCGYDPAWPSDGFNGWGNTPEQTVRFSESGQVHYRLTNLDTAEDYNVRLTFYEGDGVGRQQRILMDSTASNTITVGPTASYSLLQLPPSTYSDGEVILNIERLSPAGAVAIVSEVVLEEITRRYPFDPGTSTPTPTVTASPTPTNTPTPTSTPTPTNTPTPSPTPTPTNTPTPTPPPDDLIFADGFESASLAAWTSATTDGGDLSATSGAALVGSFGLQAVVDDNNSIYVRDISPDLETRYRARFYFDPNSIVMANNNAHNIFTGRHLNADIFRVELLYTAGAYHLNLQVRDDQDPVGTFHTTANYLLSDNSHLVEIDWQAATAPGSNNGYMTLWLDQLQVLTIASLDMDTRRVDEVRLGAVSGIDTGTRGQYYFDAFESRRQTYIGPAEIPGFHAIPTTGSVPLEVAFVNTTQRPLQITGYLWDFGDGESSTEANPTHRYEVPGHYTVTLTIFTTSGQITETRTDYIIVLDGYRLFLPLVLR
jgi:hypothetical protein